MIKKEDVRHIAKLARLGITVEEEGKFQKDLSSVLEYIELLNEVNVSDIEPTFHTTENYIDKKRIMREDKASRESEETIDQLIKAVPHKKGRHVKVKAIF